MGAQDIAVQPLNKLPYGNLSSKFAEGVVFLTYSSLISSSEKVLLLSRSCTATRGQCACWCIGICFAVPVQVQALCCSKCSGVSGVVFS